MDSNSPTRNSVLDFLYVDRARVAQFASQLLPDGNSNQVKRQSSKKSEEASSGGFDAVVAKANVQWQKGSTDVIEYTSDASWEKVEALLSELQAGKFLFDIADIPQVGSLVKLDAHIEIVAQNVFKSVWESILNAAIANDQIDPSTLGKTSVSNLAQILTVMPQPTVLLALERSLSLPLWGILKEDGFIGAKDDFALMYGGHVPGNWKIIGSLDVLPEETSENVLNVLAASEALRGIQQATTQMRAVFGRPLGSWGITPICIFREIQANHSPAPTVEA